MALIVAVVPSVPARRAGAQLTETLSNHQVGYS